MEISNSKHRIVVRQETAVKLRVLPKLKQVLQER